MKKENLNLLLTILGPIVILAVLGWISWSWQAQRKIDAAEMREYINLGYVPKSWFESSHKELADGLTKVQSDVSEIDKKVSTIQGQLSQPSYSPSYPTRKINGD